MNKKTNVRRSTNIFIKSVVLTVCIAALILAGGCGSESDKLKQRHIAAVFTSSTKEKSEIVYLDEKGIRTEVRELNRLGVFDLIKTKDKLYVPVRFGEQLLEIDMNTDSMKEIRTLEFPFHYSNVEGRQFVIYNSDAFGDIDYLTYEVTFKGQKITKRIKGFPQCMEVKDGRAYVFTDMVNENQQLINVIELSNLEIVQAIPVYCPQAGDIKVMDNYIYLTNIQGKELLKISSKEPMNRVTKQLHYESPKLMCFYEGDIIVIHERGVTVLNRDTLEVKTEHTLDSAALKAKIYNDKLYILSQENNGTILVLDIQKLTVEKSIELKGDEELLVQDFVFLK